jgi:putative phosphoribosyl transferase
MRKSVNIRLDNVVLEGELMLPDDVQGLVIFSHGSGSSRFSTRNIFVARQLQLRGIGTFLLDLLTEAEDSDYSQRFNIDLLSQRLVQVTKQILEDPELSNLPVGYFGASTGAASALVAAAILGNKISVVVSRGGRPDLAMEQIEEVEAPTLLIVGGLDSIVIKLNQEALQKLRGIKHLEIVEGATHLFEEAGTLGQVARLSADWFIQYLSVKKLVH